MVADAVQQIALTAPRYVRAGSPLVDALLADARVIGRRRRTTTPEAVAAAMAARHRHALMRALDGDEDVLAYGRRSFGSASVDVVVDGLIAEWTHGDHNSPLLLALWLAAQRAFDLAAAASLVSHPTMPRVRGIYAEFGPALEAFWLAEYRLTQDWLRSHRIRSACLWRGVGMVTSATGLRQKHVVLWPVSSWALHLPAARAFAVLRAMQLNDASDVRGMRVSFASELWHAEVPATRLLSLGLTWADPNAGELLVLGGPAEVWSLSWVGLEPPIEAKDERAYARQVRAQST